MSTEFQPLVSVVIPAHNVEGYISSCVRSVLEGDYSNIELVIIENGSTDRTGAICDEEATRDSRIRVYHTPGQGVSVARNIGIQHSAGKYICFVDGDDLVTRSYVQYLEHGMSHDNVDVAVSMPVISFTSESETEDWRDQKPVNSGVYNGEQAVESILTYKTTIGCYSKMFDLSFLRRNSIEFIESLFIGEGFNFNVKAFSKADKVFMSNKKIYFYRVNNPNSAMTKVDQKKIRNGLNALEHLEQTLTPRSQSVDDALSYAKWHTSFDFLMSMLAGQRTNEDTELFKALVRDSRGKVTISFKVSIGAKERVKAILASISPVITGKVINHFRKRKFSE
ncbi:glycosyltransferase family 2 protein [Lacticaseibacillus paracasei]|uniref:glycosyltransferase family 2 protein n=1 Tax=Lacticaseibacillus paracasei TaxID=1597 RepID=UPI002738CC77|nr:glycosyltransferase family 2 protein [Lacticaseibacillus paracasei]MDP4467179.1 glycosyltransferase family 2 protein [Lacticaseibacillus paracasei]